MPQAHNKYFPDPRCVGNRKHGGPHSYSSTSTVWIHFHLHGGSKSRYLTSSTKFKSEGIHSASSTQVKGKYLNSVAALELQHLRWAQLIVMSRASGGEVQLSVQGYSVFIGTSILWEKHTSLLRVRVTLQRKKLKTRLFTPLYLLCTHNTLAVYY